MVHWNEEQALHQAVGIKPLDVEKRRWVAEDRNRMNMNEPSSKKLLGAPGIATRSKKLL